MKIFSRISQPVASLLSTLKDRISETQAFQSLKARYDELEPKKKRILNFSIAGGSILVVVVFVMSGLINVSTLKSDYENTKDAIADLKRISSEVKDLKQKLKSFQSDSGKDRNAQTILTNMISTSMIPQDSARVGTETEGTAADNIKENSIDVILKHVSIKQVVRYCNQIENSKKGLRVKNISIDTNEDPEGYLDASIKISVYKIEGKDI